MTALKIDHSSYKIGLDEIEGLEQVLSELSQPLLKSIKSRIYWDSSLKFEPVTYKSCDGFIPHSHNCGGLSLETIIPKCEEWEFSFLDFGECDDEDCMANHDSHCGYEDEGHLDAGLRIWLKFEGLNDDGQMMFWFYVGGGNGDAPYFRTHSEATIFETSFTCSTLDDLRRVGSRRINKLLKVIK